MKVKYLIPLAIAGSGAMSAQQPAAQPSGEAQLPKARSDRKTVLQEVLQLASKLLGVPLEKIRPESNFVRDLGLDSLDAVELVLNCEDLYQITILDSEMEKAYRINDLVDVILAAPTKIVSEKMSPLYSSTPGGIYVGAVQGKKEKSHGLMYKDGRVVLPPTYDHIGLYCEGLFVVWHEKSGGAIDSTGKVVIPIRYRGLSCCVNGYMHAAVEKDGVKYWGLLDAAGTLVIDFQYEEIKDWRGHWLPVKKDGLWGFVNAQNEPMSPFEYTTLRAHQYTSIAGEPYYCAERNHKLGVITGKNELVIPFLYDAGAFGFCDSADGCYDNQVKQNDLMVQKFIEFRYNPDQTVGYATVQKDGLWGVINTQNEIVIPFQKLQLDRYDDRYQRVRAKDPHSRKWGFLGKGGAVIVQVQYDYVRNYFFSKQLEPKWIDKAEVWMGKEKYKIDLQGKRVVQTH